MILVILAGCALRGYCTPMWLDELYSFNLIQDHSLNHLLKALADQADGAPPLYYVLARLWAVMFSLNELSLRLFSATMFCVAFVLIWRTLRRAFSFWPSAVAVSLTIGTSQTISFESSNIRFYGLLFALISLAVWLAVELGIKKNPGWRLLAGNSLTQAALVLCHPLGGLYSVFLLLATTGGDLWATREFRWRVAVSYPVGWMALLFWWRQFLRQAAINSPHSWVPVPSLKFLFSVNEEVAGNAIWGGLFLLVWLLVRGVAYRRSVGDDPGTVNGEILARRLRLTVVGASLLALVPFLWMFSNLVPNNSLFLPRYFIGVSIGWMILLTHVCEAVFRRPLSRVGTGKQLLVTMNVLFVLANFGVALRVVNTTQWSFSGFADEAYGYPDLPVVCLRADEFLPRAHYSPKDGRYYFLLDWAVATAKDNPHRGAVTNYKLLSAIKRNYAELYPDRIVDAEDFLRTHPAFLLQYAPESPWMFLRLNPKQYKIIPLVATGRFAAEAASTCPFLLVRRR